MVVVTDPDEQGFHLDGGTTAGNVVAWKHYGGRATGVWWGTEIEIGSRQVIYSPIRSNCLKGKPQNGVRTRESGCLGRGGPHSGRPTDSGRCRRRTCASGKGMYNRPNRVYSILPTVFNRSRGLGWHDSDGGKGVHGWG